MMSFRVTQGMINTQLLRNLNSNLARMDATQNQLATGRKINKPSDDPVGISFAMRYRSEISANDQYIENVDSAISWLEYTDSTLDQAGNVLQRVRELSVQGASGTNPQAALDAINSEMKQLYDQLITIGNSDFNGKHVFNGQMTDIPPYAPETAMNDRTDNGPIQFEIGVGVRLPVNVTGNAVFGGPEEGNNMFKVIKDISDALGRGDYDAISNALGRLDSRMNAFLEVRSDVGAKLNRIQLAEGRLKDININMQTLQSKTEDADMAALITNLKTDENVYQASLSVGAKIIRPSLVDFLR
jgi:flagellar hook-associated protein 3 FlgL